MAKTRQMQMTTAPTASYAEAERQRALADSLQQRALAPRNMQGMQGNDALFLGMTQLGEALLAAKMGRKAANAEGAADAQMRDANAAAIEKLAGPYQIESLDVGGEGTPLAGGSLPGSTIQTALAGTDPRQANQIVANALLQRAIPAPMDPDKAAQRDLTREQIAATREGNRLTLEQRMRELEWKSQDATANREQRAQAAKDASDLRRQLAQMQADTARYVADSRRDTAAAATQQKADAAAAAAAASQSAKDDFMANAAANVTDEVSKALEIVNNEMGTTGLIGGMAQYVGGTDARALKGHLDTIKANLGFDRLQQMRDMSKTGGALGSIAVKELEALQASVASLDQAQDKKVLRSNLEKIGKHYARWRKAFDGTLREFDTEEEALASGVFGEVMIGGKKARID